jgi:hypothetical protein
MNRRTRTYQLFFLVVVVFICNTVIAQLPSVKTFVDKRDILIGEYIEYKIVAAVPKGVFNIRWLHMPDSVRHFELVQKNKIDTSIDNNNTVLTQTLVLTSFDSGRWYTPSFNINFEPIQKGKALIATTDSFAINVGYAPIDSTNQPRDIKPIIEVTVTNYLWYYIAGGVLLLLLIGWLLYRYFKKQRLKPALEFAGKLSAYDEAMQEINKLKTLPLQQPDAIKQYHAKLATIFKWYISRKHRLSVMNKTSGDVLVYLAANKLPQENIASAATALRLGDAVKFAKYMPAANEHDMCLQHIVAVIQFIHTSNKQQ